MFSNQSGDASCGPSTAQRPKNAIGQLITRFDSTLPPSSHHQQQQQQQHDQQQLQRHRDSLDAATHLSPAERQIMDDVFSSAKLHPALAHAPPSAHVPQMWSNEFVKFQHFPNIDSNPNITPQLQINQSVDEMAMLNRQFEVAMGKQKMAAAAADLDWQAEFSKFERQHIIDANDAVLESVWESEAVRNLTDSLEESVNFEERWGDALGNGGGEDSTVTNAWADEFLRSEKKIVDLEYPFESDNPYLQHADPLSEGLKLVASKGSLTLASLCFEAAVQRDALNVEAWSMLGHAQAENEKESPAIAAFQQAIKLDPTHLKSLMSLAVSYTNEGYDNEAFKALYQWIRVKNPQVTPLDLEKAPSFEIFDTCLHYYLEAARQSQNQVDSDLQVGLGVLFYNSGQYDKAVDCFKTALQVRPMDYLLWNRLGATLANSGKSEEAIDAYFKALDLNQNFVRARYNLGVSCMNIGCYKDAAEHFLSALQQCEQPVSKAVRNTPNNLWETLRRALILMERNDLADKAYPGASLAIFRPTFEF